MPTFLSKEKMVPEENLALITIGNSGSKDKAFYSVSGSDVRKEALNAMGEKYHITFTPEEQTKFANTEVFGVPISGLKQFLAMNEDEREKIYQQPGIPIDTTARNEDVELVDTLRARPKEAYITRDLDVAIKGDKKEQYPTSTSDSLLIYLGQDKRIYSNSV